MDFLIHFISIFRNKKATRKLKECGRGIQIGINSQIVCPENIVIGDCFYAGDRTFLQTWEYYRGERTGSKPCLKIGNNVSFMSNCHISCANRITIGDGTLFGDNVFVTDNYHGAVSVSELDIPPIERKLYVGKEVTIGKNVWVGRNVCIMPGVHIGDGVIIGANSVVTHDVPQGCVVGGVPAHLIRSLIHNKN